MFRVPTSFGIRSRWRLRLPASRVVFPIEPVRWRTRLLRAFNPDANPTETSTSTPLSAGTPHASSLRSCIPGDPSPRSQPLPLGYPPVSVTASRHARGTSCGDVQNAVVDADSTPFPLATHFARYAMKDPHDRSTCDLFGPAPDQVPTLDELAVRQRRNTESAAQRSNDPQVARMAMPTQARGRQTQSGR